MEKALFIDGNSLLHRAFHALPPLRTSKGVYTNAVYGFLNMFFRILEEEEPDYIAVAFDKKGPTFRHKKYKAYKATRSKTADELIGQFDILKDILKSLNICYLELDNFEADDILGMLSKIAEDKGIFSVIVTGDKDALQLVSDKTNVMLTRRGITNMDRYAPANVIEKHGISPEQVPDFKGLKGDKSDNIPGVPGIGVKTASKLLKEFGSVENILQNTEKLKGKMKERIIKYKQQLIDSKYLATIVCKPQIDIEIEALAKKDPDWDKALMLFREYEFYSFVNRLKKNLSDTDLDNNHEKIEVVIIEDINKLQKTINKIKEKSVAIILDIKEKDYIKGIALCYGETSYYTAFELIEQNTKAQTLLKQLLEDEKTFKIVYNNKKVRKLLRDYDIDFRCQFDPMIAAYLLEPSKPKYDLESISFAYLGREIHGLDVVQKAKHLYDLKDVMSKRLKEANMDELFYDVEMPLSSVLADMEYEGMKVDVKKLEELSYVFGKKLEELTQRIHDYAGGEFNINSPKQLGEILFDKLGLPVIKKTKTGYSTNAEVLETLKPYHPIIEDVLEYRFLMKMKSTYSDGLLGLVDERTSKIHTSFNQTVTTTGRISSTEPNLQNIPVKNKLGKHIRGVFVASEPNHVLLSGDYSQIELRILAHVSEDEGLIKAFISGEDIHTKTASEVFNVPIEEVTPLLRDKAKAVNFGIVYGISDYGLAKNLNISPKEAGKYIETYFDRYPGVRDFIREAIRKAKHTGYVTTLLNRRRYIPDIMSRNFMRRSFAERTAMNTPIQGSAADIIKIAMVKVYRDLKENNLKTKMLLQVHDELIFDVPENEISSVRKIVKHDMENALSLKVPLIVDFKQGRNWEEL